MKTIKLYITSSEDLVLDRAVIGNLVRQLNIANRPIGFEVELYDADDSDIESTVSSDMFVALFHCESDEMSFVRVEQASESYKNKQQPKVFIYFKDLNEGDTTDEALVQFKEHICNELGHFVNRYRNEDSIKFSIVMQVMQVNGTAKAEIKESKLMLGDETIADMGNLPFAADNEYYQKMKTQIVQMQEELPSLKQKFRENPDDEDAEEEYFRVKNKVRKLGEELEEYEKHLFETALTFSKISGEKYSERIAKAMELFQQGKVSEADEVLDAEQMKKEAEKELAQFKQDKSNLETIIEEYRLKASTSIANMSLIPEERTASAESAYDEAVRIAEDISYDAEKFVKLLLDYSDFLDSYAKYDKSIDIAKRAQQIAVCSFSEKHEYVARSNNNLGVTYLHKGEYDTAIVFIQKALEILLETLDENHPNVATCYDNLGVTYSYKGEYDTAIKFSQKSLEILLKGFGKNHRNVALCYNNLGVVYDYKGEYDTAIKFSQKALKIGLETLGENHPDIAMNYHNIGLTYGHKGEHDNAIKFFQKSLKISLKEFGNNHPNVALCYNNLGAVYDNMGEYDKAIGYYQKSIEIYRNYLGENHSHTVTAYENICDAFRESCDYENEILHYKILLDIKSSNGEDQSEIARINNNIAVAYRKLGQYEDALNYENEAMEIAVKTNNKNFIAAFHNRLALIYKQMGDNAQALKHFQSASTIFAESGDVEQADQNARLANELI